MREAQITPAPCSASQYLQHAFDSTSALITDLFYQAIDAILTFVQWVERQCRCNDLETPQRFGHGIQNRGIACIPSNVCYLSAVLQAIRATPRIVQICPNDDPLRSLLEIIQPHGRTLAAAEINTYREALVTAGFTQGSNGRQADASEMRYFLFNRVGVPIWCVQKLNDSVTMRERLTLTTHRNRTGKQLLLKAGAIIDAQIQNLSLLFQDPKTTLRHLVIDQKAAPPVLVIPVYRINEDTGIIIDTPVQPAPLSRI